MMLVRGYDRKPGRCNEFSAAYLESEDEDEVEGVADLRMKGDATKKMKVKNMSLGKQ